MKRWGDATGKMVAGETDGRTDGGHDREREWGRGKRGSLDLHGGREGRRQSRSPIRSICRLGGRRKGDENRGGEKCHPSVSIAPPTHTTTNETVIKTNRWFHNRPRTHIHSCGLFHHRSVAGLKTCVVAFLPLRPCLLTISTVSKSRSPDEHEGGHG